jgi:hypothetical protein
MYCPYRIKHIKNHRRFDDWNPAIVRPGPHYCKSGCLGRSTVILAVVLERRLIQNQLHYLRPFQGGVEEPLEFVFDIIPRQTSTP